MNRSIKYAAGAIAGGALGYFVGSIVADYVEEKELRDRGPLSEDEEMEDDEEDDSSRNAQEMLKANKKNRPSRLKTDYTKHFISQGRPDLAALAEKYNSGNIPVDASKAKVTLLAEDEFEMVIAPIMSNEKLNGITIISHDDFTNNQDDFEVVELSYYMDDLIVGEDDNIIPEPEDIIGTDALVSFGMLSGDPDIVYVRNPKIRALYEIVRMSIKYAIDSDAEKIIPRKGLKQGIDFDEVNNDEDDEEEKH